MPLFYVGFSMLWCEILVTWSVWWSAYIFLAFGLAFLVVKSRPFKLSGIGVILGAFLVILRHYFDVPSLPISYISELFSPVSLWFSSTLREWLDSDISYTLLGMIVGDKSMLPYSVYSAFLGSGIVHLLSVSGFHTSLWSMMVYKGCIGLGFGRRLSSVICVVFICIFVVVTGFSLSTVRAGVMFIIFFLGRALSLSSSSLNSLGLSAILVLIFTPSLSVGFLLSFFSTLGILIIYPKWNSWVKEWTEKRDFNGPFSYRIRSLGRLFGIQISVFVFTLPILSLTVGNLSLASFFSNALVGWAASFSILLGGLGTIMSFIPFIGRPLLLLSALLVKYILFVASIFSGWSLCVGFSQFIVTVGIILLLKGFHILLK